MRTHYNKIAKSLSELHDIDYKRALSLLNRYQTVANTTMAIQIDKQYEQFKTQ